MYKEVVVAAVVDDKQGNGHGVIHIFTAAQNIDKKLY